MTAADIFARKDATWLFSHTATYDDDGYVLQFSNKVTLSTRLGTAVGIRFTP